MGLITPLMTETRNTLEAIIAGTKDTVIQIGAVATCIVAVPVTAAITPYIFPTVGRITKDYGAGEDLFIPAFSLCTMISTIAQFACYVSMAVDGAPEYFAIPVATNLLSGIYENVQKHRRKY